MTRRLTERNLSSQDESPDLGDAYSYTLPEIISNSLTNKFDLVMLNAKLFDKLFGKTQIVWQILTLFGKHLFCLADIIFVRQTNFVLQIHCFCLANRLRDFEMCRMNRV